MLDASEGRRRACLKCATIWCCEVVFGNESWAFKRSGGGDAWQLSFDAEVE